MPLRSDPEAGKHPPVNWQQVPLDGVKEDSLRPGVFKWGGFEAAAESQEEGRRLIEQQWNDREQARSSIPYLKQQRDRERWNLESKETQQQRQERWTVVCPNTKEEFHGRRWKEDDDRRRHPHHHPHLR